MELTDCADHMAQGCMLCTHCKCVRGKHIGARCTRVGIKEAAVFSEDCTMCLSNDGWLHLVTAV